MDLPACTLKFISIKFAEGKRIRNLKLISNKIVPGNARLLSSYLFSLISIVHSLKWWYSQQKMSTRLRSAMKLMVWRGSQQVPNTTTIEISMRLVLWRMDREV